MVSAISFMEKNRVKIIIKIVHPITIITSLIIVFILGPLLCFNINFMGRIYPNIYVAGIYVGGKTPGEAALSLSSRVRTPEKINLVTNYQSFELNTKDINLSYDYTASLERAYSLVRTGNFLYDSIYRIGLLFYPENLGLTTVINDGKLSTIISIIDGQVTTNPISPSLENINGSIQVNKGAAGNQIDFGLFRSNIGYNLSFANSSDINIPIIVNDPSITDSEALTAKTRAEKYLGKSLTGKFESQSFNFNDSEIIKFINPLGGYNDPDLTDAVSKIASSVNKDPQNPKFEFNGTKVTEFLPALDGIKLDNEKLRTEMVNALDTLPDSTNGNVAFDIPVTKNPPEVTTSQVNNLGIKELIGTGNSTYFHSIPGRVFNVNLAASRINGTLVKPGETFSFNQTLGDVSKFTGYQQAYIISNGRTVLGDGGGVCQVSTTLFRAVLNAGLPIDQRAAHAYRVGYYEQNSPPGMDATVYSPSPDFKFTNDTGNYILIEAKNDPANYALVFQLYGTSDGRVSTLSKPVVSNVSAPLPTVYQDDPTLPNGTLKQTDFAAWGAKIVFDYSVTRNGEQIYQKTFISNYQPWAAVFLRGTKTI